MLGRIERLGAGEVADAGDRVPRAIEARQASDVDVKQSPGPRPLIAALALTSAPAPLRETVAMKHLPDRRASPAADPGQAPRAETGLPARPQDRLLLGGAEPPWLAVRPRGAVPQPAPAATILITASGAFIPSAALP